MDRGDNTLKLTFYTLPDGRASIYTDNHAAGAIPNGTRVYKADAEAGDTHSLGAGATVIGSVDVSRMTMPKGALRPSKYFYFVAWDDTPGIITVCVDWKLSEAE
jgi:hypothetical protein